MMESVAVWPGPLLDTPLNVSVYSTSGVRSVIVYSITLPGSCTLAPSKVESVNIHVKNFFGYWKHY